jgi:ribose 5-phosphate isomerase B
MSVFSKNLPVSIGCDHAGFEYKEAIKKYLQDKGWEIIDHGTHSLSSVDYPDFAHPTAVSVETGKASFGILICGSANGVAITANKHQGVRAGLSFDLEVSKLIRQHNDANIICLPARFIALPYALQMVDAFIDTPFEGGRHANRVAKISC